MPAKSSASRRGEGLPSAPFFATPEQRVALARERFFEEGVRPSGLVPELVIQSWARCMGARRAPDEAISFDPVSKARVSTVLARNRLLLEAARSELSELDAALAGTRCKAILTSHDGVVVHATSTDGSDGVLMPIVTRVGVDLGESAIGTGAPGVAARTGEVALVQGAEHYFSGNSVMYCAAAPIRDVRGDVAAVLDLSSESEMFRFDAASMVSLYATAIENRLLAAQARSQLLLRFQASPSLLHTPLAGLAAVNGDGRVAWFNGSGSSLMGCERVPAWDARAEALFGLDVEGLLALSHRGRAQPLRLPNGLTLWVEAQLDGREPALTQPPDAAAIEAAAAEPTAAAAGSAPATLRDANRHLIEQTLTECKGNVSRTARCLGVSRGLLYRRLRAWGLA